MPSMKAALRDISVSLARITGTVTNAKCSCPAGQSG